MKIENTHLPGVKLIYADKHEDERGIFSPLVLSELNPPDRINFDVIQINSVFTKLAGTFRGLHGQKSPHGQAKLVTTDKPIEDTVVDPYTGAWGKFKIEKGIYILVPRNYLHGYLTLWNRTNVTYFVDESFNPVAEYGMRYDKSGIKWGDTKPTLVSKKDMSW